MDTTPKNKKAMSMDEVSLLVDLINCQRILTSKETNAYTNKLKDDAWTSLTLNFNAKSGQIPRQKEQLKLKWDNLKKAARKRAQLIRMNNLNTGEGKPDLIPADEILDKVAGLLGSTCSGFEVPFGGDSTAANVDDNTEMLSTLAKANVPNQNEIIEIQDEAQKRKHCEIHDEEPKRKKKYGMPMMARPLQINTKKKKIDSGARERNLAMAEYYKKKSIKLDLEIELLKLQLVQEKERAKL